MLKYYDETSKESILEYAKLLKGKTFGEIDKSQKLRSEKGKGNLGVIIEEEHFGYKANSNSEADFKEAGIELKVTPYKINKNKTVSAKERLVLNIINYMEEYKTTFETSSFWKKNKELLIIYYEWSARLTRDQYIIQDVFLHEFSENDLFIIKNDWKTIIDKIKVGEAHLISEGDTQYLAACTKGANKHSLREQPFSTERAMQRAFSLKSSYMTALLRRRLNDEKSFSIIGDKPKTIEQVLDELFSPYYSKKVEEIAEELDHNLYTADNKLPKSYLQLLVSRLLGIKSAKLEKLDTYVEEFAKANITVKTIRIECNGKIKEHMSFPTFKYQEIIDQEWETSDLRTLFAEQKYLFVVFQFDENNELYLKNIKLWNMPLQELDTSVKDTWEETVKVLREGVQITTKNDRDSDNMPGSKFNGICHVRPHAQSKQDTYPLPDGREYVKKCFWLDKEYILEVIKS